jgi:ABC-type sugar transport system permease subunit
MTVVNYSVQDILSPTQKVFVGLEWFREVMQDPDLHGALVRQLLFSACVLLLQVPLGIAVALAMPAQGWRASLTLVLLALPLLVPWNVVGTVWQIFAREDIGLMGQLLARAGFGIGRRWWRSYATPACAPFQKRTTKPRVSMAHQSWRCSAIFSCRSYGVCCLLLCCSA